MFKNRHRKIYKVFNKDSGKYESIKACGRWRLTWLVNPSKIYPSKTEINRRPELEIHIFEMIQVGTLDNLGKEIK